MLLGLICCPHLTLVAKQSEAGDYVWILFHTGGFCLSLSEESENDDRHQNLILEKSNVLLSPHSSQIIVDYDVC